MGEHGILPLGGVLNANHLSNDFCFSAMMSLRKSSRADSECKMNLKPCAMNKSFVPKDTFRGVGHRVCDIFLNGGSHAALR
jgi:hypothetical protein